MVVPTMCCLSASSRCALLSTKTRPSPVGGGATIQFVMIDTVVLAGNSDVRDEAGEVQASLAGSELPGAADAARVKFVSWSVSEGFAKLRASRWSEVALGASIVAAHPRSVI